MQCLNAALGVWLADSRSALRLRVRIEGRCPTLEACIMYVLFLIDRRVQRYIVLGSMVQSSSQARLALVVSKED